MSFPKFVYMTKNTPCFQILNVFAPLNDVRMYSAWSWKTTLIMWIFGWAWYPLDIRVAPWGFSWYCKTILLQDIWIFSGLWYCVVKTLPVSDTVKVEFLWEDIFAKLKFFLKMCEDLISHRIILLVFATIFYHIKYYSLVNWYTVCNIFTCKIPPLEIGFLQKYTANFLF